MDGSTYSCPTTQDPPHTPETYSSVLRCHRGGPHRFYVINNDIDKAGHAHLPSWFTEIAGIYEFEIAGGLLSLHAASFLWPGHPLLLRIDNSAASPTLVRGNCPSPLGATIASAFWAAAAAYGTPVWVGEVRTKFNIADAPSRQCAHVSDQPPFTRPNTGAPDVFNATFASNEALERFRLRCNAKNSEFSPPWDALNLTPRRSN